MKTSNMKRQRSVTNSMNMKGWLQRQIYLHIKYKYFILMFLPVIAYFIIFKYLPLTGLIIAFKDFRINEGMFGSPWAGLKHFEQIFTMPSFLKSFKNTLLLSSYKLIFGFPAPIIFALLLNEVNNSKFKKVVQTISYMPHFLSWVVLGGLFTQFLSPSTGPINIALKAMNLEPIYFLGSTKWFRGTLVATYIWQSIGWGSIVYIAALSGIDTAMYEAAEIDGANRFQKMVRITLPSLAPVVTIMLILAIGKIVNDDFDQVFNLYNSAVLEVGDVLGTFTYRLGIAEMSYEKSTAIGLFQSTISTILILFANSISRRVNEYGIW